jgi:hypothetical protein
MMMMMIIIIIVIFCEVNGMSEVWWGLEFHYQDLITNSTY